MKGGWRSRRLAFLDRGKDGAAKRGGFAAQLRGLRVLAQFLQDPGPVAQCPPTVGVGIERVDRRGDVAAVGFARQQPVGRTAVLQDDVQLALPVRPLVRTKSASLLSE